MPLRLAKMGQPLAKAKSYWERFLTRGTCSVLTGNKDELRIARGLHYKFETNLPISKGFRYQHNFDGEKSVRSHGNNSCPPPRTLIGRGGGQIPKLSVASLNTTLALGSLPKHKITGTILINYKNKLRKSVVWIRIRSDQDFFPPGS